MIKDHRIEDDMQSQEDREALFKEALYSADNNRIVGILIDIITEDPGKAKRIFELVDDVFWVDRYKDKIIDEYLKG